MTFGRFPIITQVNLPLIFYYWINMITVNYFNVEDETLTPMRTEKLNNNYGYPVVGSKIDIEGVMWDVVDIDEQQDLKFNICEVDVFMTDKIYKL